jgi:hypothetical protein
MRPSHKRGSKEKILRANGRWWSRAVVTVLTLVLGGECAPAGARDEPQTVQVVQYQETTTEKARARASSGMPRSNPTLQNISPNTALDLGRYTCSEPADHPIGCESITDYSGFRYDSYHHRMLMFGGGHGPAIRTDIAAFDLSALRWGSLYRSTPAASMTAANNDTERGAWISTGHPVVRHTYDMLAVAEVGNEKHFIILTSGGIPGRAKIAHYDLLSATPRWTYSRAPADGPWYYAAAAEYDPESKLILIIGLGVNASPGRLWRYDPATQKVDTVADVPVAVGYANNLVYFPPNRRMYLLARGAPTRVFEVALKGRLSGGPWVSEVTGITGDIPNSQESGWAYDSANMVIGGGILDGTFYAYDPLTKHWTSQRMQASSTEGAKIGTLAFHALDYEPITNLYIFLTDAASGRRTWAYRFTKSEPPGGKL